MDVGTDITVTVDQRPLVNSFQVSHLTTETVDIVTLRLSAVDGQLTGLGEISADAGYGQFGEAIAAQASELAASLVQDPDIGEPDILSARLDACAGRVSGCALMLVEMAFLDRAARLRGLPVWRLLGLPDPGVVRLVTTVPLGERLPETGPVKVKLGGADDLATLRRLTTVDGPVLLDVNRGWGRREWESVRDVVAEIAPVVLEDPVNDDDLLAEVRAALPGTAVVLDERVGDLDDVVRAAEIADGANVKVMKVGGLFPARRALDHLTANGAIRMLGCFLEPPRAVAYAAQLNGIADWSDLDGHFWVSPDHPPVSEYRLDSGRPGIPTIAP